MVTCGYGSIQPSGGGFCERFLCDDVCNVESLLSRAASDEAGCDEAFAAIQEGRVFG
jgi:hypothetical protein